MSFLDLSLRLIACPEHVNEDENATEDDSKECYERAIPPSSPSPANVAALHCRMFPMLPFSSYTPGLSLIPPLVSHSHCENLDVAPANSHRTSESFVWSLHSAPWHLRKPWDHTISNPEC